jgi:hypothetical protein
MFIGAMVIAFQKLYPTSKPSFRVRIAAIAAGPPHPLFPDQYARARARVLVQNVNANEPTLDFTVFAIDIRGHKHLLAHDPGSLATGHAKNELADALREEFRQKDIIRYVLIAECWFSRVAPMPSGPVTRDYATTRLHPPEIQCFQSNRAPGSSIQGLRVADAKVEKWPAITPSMRLGRKPRSERETAPASRRIRLGGPSFERPPD